MTPIRLLSQSQRDYAKQCIDNAPAGYIVRIAEPTRTDEQNRALWPKLQDIASQVEWHGETLTREEWKDVFTAALHKQKAVPGIDGGLVFLGRRSSKMGKAEFSDLLELINAFGAERGVVWSEKDVLGDTTFEYEVAARSIYEKWTPWSR